VVNKRGLGPVLAVACKGMTGAFRNLINRMEETIGDVAMALARIASAGLLTFSPLPCA
jgi:hypothetical protein